jgi:hypothetical protein
MATIVTREVGASNVGRPLTNSELDNNFINLNTDVTTALSTTAVTPGNYIYASIAVDARGRITYAGNGSVLTWKGNWDSIDTYKINDIVKYDNSYYICIDPNTNVNPYNPGIANYKWSYFIKQDLSWKGAWSASPQYYYLNDIVSYNGSIYVCIIDHMGNIGVTPTATGWWTLLATNTSGSLTFIGDVTGSGTTGSNTSLTLSTSGVTAGNYINPNIVVDSKGRITSASNGSASTGLPTGGSNTQVLVKNSSTNYDVSFVSINTGYLSDVSITSAANNQILQYDGATSKWKNTTSPYAPLASPNFTGTVSGITKAMVGLGNVENTALSTWTGSTNITSLGTVTVGSAPASDVYTWAKQSTKPSYTASEVGLGNVTNESKATMFANSTLTGTTTIATATITNATVATAPSNNTDVVNKLYSDSGTQTLTNKRLQSRVNVATSSTTWAVSGDSFDVTEMYMTGAAGTILISAPTGTPVNGQKLIYKLRSTYAQTLSWASIFAGSTDIALPTPSSGGDKWDYYGFIYNSTPVKWQLVAKVSGF